MYLMINGTQYTAKRRSVRDGRLSRGSLYRGGVKEKPPRRAARVGQRESL